MQNLNALQIVDVRWSKYTTFTMSLYDIVQRVTHKGLNATNAVISNMRVKHEQLFLNYGRHRFPGPGQKTGYTVTTTQAVEFVSLLGGCSANQFCVNLVDNMTLLLGGNTAMHDEISAYVQSNVFVQNMLGCKQRTHVSNPHSEGQMWVSANVDTLAIATGMCPMCGLLVLGVPMTGGIVKLEGRVPRTNRIADVLIHLPDGTHVAIEVAHTHDTSWRKKFEYDQADITMYEVETAEIQCAITSGHKILRTTTMKSVGCKACVI
jgi:hypothetical protein